MRCSRCPGIEIDHECLEALHSKRGSDIDGGGRLTDPALLIRDGEHPASTRPLQRLVGGVQDPHRTFCCSADGGVEFCRCFT